MKRYVLGPDAAKDLEAIWDYIAADKASAATRWIEKLLGEFERLALQPGLGHRREEWTNYEVLFWPVSSYLIIYRDNDPLEIVAVTHGSRDIPAFLSRRLAY